MYVWGAVSSAIAAAGWAFDTFYYTPSLTTKREMELFVEAEKASLLRVYQSFSLLRDLAPFRNAERIAMFCKIQMVRNDALALPPNLMSAIDKASLLKSINELQQQHCVTLHCRDAPLSSEESWRCTLAFGIFVLAFRLVFPILAIFRCCSDGGLVKEAAKVGKLILDIIEVDVDLTLDPIASRLASQGSADGSVIEAVWCPTSWVEEAAFWAAPTNPWTAQRTDTTASLTSQAVRLLSLDESHRNATERYEHRFQKDHSALAAIANSSQTDASRAKLFDGCLPESTFGYPRSLRDVELRAESSRNGCDVFYTPVVSLGVEKLTYMGDAFASSDLTPLKSSTDRYADIVELTYGSGNTLKSPQAVEVTKPAAAQAAVTMTNHLPFVEMPLLSRESMTSIFGGRVKGSGRRRTIFIYVGAPSVQADAWKAHVGAYAELANRAALIGV